MGVTTRLTHWYLATEEVQNLNLQSINQSDNILYSFFSYHIKRIPPALHLRRAHVYWRLVFWYLFHRKVG